MLAARVVRPLASRAALCAPAFGASAARCASTHAGAHTEPAVPAHLNTKRPDMLLKFKHASTVREVYHFTSYALAAGVPIALLAGGAASAPIDFALGFIIPLHFHIGMRSVIVDYVHDVPMQRLALALLAGATVLTAAGLTKLNVSDIGITGAVQAVFTKQPEPLEGAAKPSKF